MSGKSAITLVDLDDTLFQTLRKCPDDIPFKALEPLGYLQDGTALSYATPRQMALIRWLCETTVFIPVTARSLDALHRVRIPFIRAICAHGGVILDDDGGVDAAWRERMKDASSRYAPHLTAMVDAINAEALRRSNAVYARIISEGDIDLYVVVKDRNADEGALNDTTDSAVPVLPEGWTDHRNGNNVALMPPMLGKQFAVAELLPRLRATWPDLPVIGIGDSITDAPFMALCDFAMTPTGGQLARTFSHG